MVAERLRRLAELKERLNRRLDTNIAQLTDGDFRPLSEPIDRAAKEAGKWAWAGWLVFLFSRKPGVDRSNVLGVAGAGIAVLGLLLPGFWFSGIYSRAFEPLMAWDWTGLTLGETTYYFSFAPRPWGFFLTPEFVGLILALTRFRLLLWGPAISLLPAAVIGGWGLYRWLELSLLLESGGMGWLSWGLRGIGACLMLACAIQASVDWLKTRFARPKPNPS